MTPRFLFALVFLFSFAGSALSQSTPGQIDLSKHDFSKEGVSLSGDWEFYWDRLLTPSDFSTDQHPGWIKVPGTWRDKFGPLGCATYRIKVTMPPDHHGLSLYFPIINSSGRVWLNGILAAEAGTVSCSRDDYRAKLSSIIVTVPERDSVLEVVVQAANYTYFNSGLGRSPWLDVTGRTFTAVGKFNGVENFFAGCLIAMCIYQLILFFIYHRGRPHFWLALICLGVAMRAMIVHGGSFLLPDLFPDVDMETWKKIEFGSVYSAVAFFPMYVYELFKGHAPRWPAFIFLGVSAILVVVVLLTPQYTYGKFLEVTHLALLLGFVYAFYSISRAWKAGNRDARVILLGVLAAFPFIFGEILNNTELLNIYVPFNYMVESGVLVFLAFQVYLLANHYENSYLELESMNLGLEKAVTDRTRELVTANTVKDRLLSVMSHDIKSPLNSLRGILGAYETASINAEEFKQLKKQVEGDLSTTSMLVDNILYWTTSQLKGVSVHKEKMDFQEMVLQNIKLFQTLAERKNVTLAHNLHGKMEIKGDRNILNLVLRNLLSNAIKFSRPNGEVSVRVQAKDSSVLIEVVDNGVGMDSTTLQAVFSGGNSISLPGTANEKGTGLGLSLCREYLHKAGGTLTVESVQGQGTTFTVEIPA